MTPDLESLIHDGEPVLSEKDAWRFERSSGYAGYRNLVTGEWVYAEDFERHAESSPEEKTNEATADDVPF